MRKIGILASLACPLAFVFGCGGGSSMPVVTITPWQPRIAPNPLVLSVKVSNKGSYTFLDSSGPTTSKLMVTGRDGSNQIIGTTIEQNIAVSGWGDGGQSITLSKAQSDVCESANTKTVIFEVVILCQKGAHAPTKITDQEILTKP